LPREQHAEPSRDPVILRLLFLDDAQHRGAARLDGPDRPVEEAVHRHRQKNHENEKI
jgi:hypothetical protein